MGRVGRSSDVRLMWIIARRMAVSAAAFVVVHSLLAIRYQWDIQEWMIGTARAWGAQPIFESRALAWGPDGPFFGDGWKVRVFNFMASRGAWWVELGAGLAAACLVYGVCLWWELRRWRGYRGETRCGGCGYGLKGLREMRCPECGKGI